MLADVSIPMLPCRELESTRHFYSDLGFKRVSIKFGADRYLILLRPMMVSRMFRWRH